MPYSYPLERVYLAKEYSRDEPSRTRIVGTLLDSAFDAPPPAQGIDRLCRAIESAPTRH